MLETLAHFPLDPFMHNRLVHRYKMRIKMRSDHLKAPSIRLSSELLNQKSVQNDVPSPNGWDLHRIPHRQPRHNVIKITTCTLEGCTGAYQQILSTI